MYKKVLEIIFIVILLFNTGVQAQINGFVNKIKDKGKTAKENNSTSSVNKNNENLQNGTRPSNETTKTETEFELANENGYSSGTARSTYDMLVRYNNPLKPYDHIRKVGEKGVLHFAKDYSELSEITQAEIKNATISFSSQPYKGENGMPAIQFSSANGHIYARLAINGTTLKHAFNLDENNYKINVDYHIYPVSGEQFKLWSSHVVLYLSTLQMNKSILDFDIKPSPSAITTYNDPNDKYAYYIPAFASLHYDEFFPKSGAYKIGIKISVPLKNEWGKSTGATMETMGFFEYQFDIKDAKTISDEGIVVRNAIQNGIRFTPKPLPKEWKLTSASSVVAGYAAAKYNAIYRQFYKDVKIIKTYLSPIAGPAWKVIMSNDNLMPAYKYCTQTVFFFVKDAGGNCYYHACDLRQDYTGGGTYGNIHLAVFDEEKVYVNCNDMK